MRVQAEVVVHVARRRGEQVPEALLAIREATRELRATLEALRDDDTRLPCGSTMSRSWSNALGRPGWTPG
ncbi:hypothetical protein [Nonomuraea jabiensis]|uniref:hypothetical protein n=1 Tax=Nonomuraea jabiensis TaxID=882448 RepID=UPI0036A487F1